MRRIKAIYIILPIGILLVIGGALGGYFGLIAPQMEKVKAARAEWDKAKAAAMDAESGYQQALDDQVKFATQYYQGHQLFKIVQSEMPDIYSLGDVYTGDDARKREGLRELYRLMGSGELTLKLRRWAKSFHIPVRESFVFTGTLGYESTLPSVKMLEYDFGQQTFYADGYKDLVEKVRHTYGHGYCPLIITPSGGGTAPADPAAAAAPAAAATDPAAAPAPAADAAAGGTAGGSGGLRIYVNKNKRYNPKRPPLIMHYTAKGYCMLRGWEPGSAADVAQAKQLIENPPQAEPARTSFPNGGCPPVLFFIQQPNVTP